MCYLSAFCHAACQPKKLWDSQYHDMAISGTVLLHMLVSGFVHESVLVPRHSGTLVYQLQYPVPGVSVSTRGTHEASGSHSIPAHTQQISFSYKTYQLTNCETIKALGTDVCQMSISIHCFQAAVEWSE